MIRPWRMILVILFVFCTTELSYSAPGDLDLGFGKDGRILYRNPESWVDDVGRAVAVQEDGKIIILAESNGLLVFRYLPDGTLDPTFGVNGEFRYMDSSAQGNAVALQPDGKIIIVGNLNSHVMVLRCNADGTLDNTFGTNGLVTCINGSSDEGNAVAIQPDGKIVIAGGTQLTPVHALVLRLNSDGTFDDGFGNGGMVIGTWGSNGTGLAVQPDGKVVIAGGRDLQRFLEDGTPDPDFGQGGVVAFELSPISSHALALQKDGKIVVLAEFHVMDPRHVLLRFKQDGTPDRTFGSEGHSLYWKVMASSLAIQPDGKILVLGAIGKDMLFHMLVLRFRPDGELDATFGDQGVGLYNARHPGWASGSGIALQTNGRIVSTGEVRYHDGNSDLDILTIRIKGWGPVTLASPFTGESLLSGSTHKIEWVMRAPVQKCRLEFSTDNGLTWKAIHLGYLTGTTYDWEVPTPNKNNSRCLIKVSGFDEFGKFVAKDESGSLAIKTVQAESPDVADILTSGDIHRVTWRIDSTTRPVASVALWFTVNGGKMWWKMATLQGNPGSYDWTVPDIPNFKKQCKVRVLLMDAGGAKLGSDETDGFFRINPAPGSM